MGSDEVTSKGKNTLRSQRDLTFEDKLGWSPEGDLPEAEFGVPRKSDLQGFPATDVHFDW